MGICRLKRLFTFGCSFTNYNWPTWADILGTEFSEFENWGQTGAGNYFIFNSLIECNLRNNISKDDVVCIMWTNVAREDTYVDGTWVTKGNLLNDKDKNVIDSVNYRGSYIRDLSLIYAANALLKSIGCKYYFFSMVPMLNTDQYTVRNCDEKIEDIIPYYKELLNVFYPSVFEAVFNFDWGNRADSSSPLTKNQIFDFFQTFAGSDWPSLTDILNGNFKKANIEISKEISDLLEKEAMHKKFDLHPVPTEHLAYLQIVVPELYELISDDTKQWAQDYTLYLTNSQSQYQPWKNPNMPKKRF